MNPNFRKCISCGKPKLKEWLADGKCKACLQKKGFKKQNEFLNIWAINVIERMRKK